MSCAKREKTGSCGHSQCPFPEASGYNCVDLFPTKDRTLCEAGDGCVATECEFSWPASDVVTTDRVVAQARKRYG